MKRNAFRASPRCVVSLVCLAVGLGALGPATHCPAQGLPARFLIETAQVTAAMQDGQLPVDGVRVQFAAPVTALVSAARINVSSASAVGAHKIRLRLACSHPGECLPFLALATYPDGVDVRTLHIGRNPNAPSDRESGLQSPAAADAARSVKTVATRGSEFLRVGSKAMLEFEADRIHVRIEVISLQSGAAGSRIRVSSIDHKQIYTAEVITPTLLKGDLAQ